MHIVTIVILVTLAGVGCSRSPEARRDEHLAKGKDFLRKNDASRAILEFRNAAQATPNHAESWYQLGVASLAVKDIRSAVIVFRKALEIDPKHAGAELKLAQIMASASENTWVKEAETRLRALMEHSPVNPEMLNALALAELRLGKTDDALRTLEQSVSAAPDELNSSILLARARLLKRDPAGAEAVLQKAAETTPGRAQPRVVLGQFYQSQSKLAEAEAEFRRALAIEPGNELALFHVARLQNATGRKADAEQTYKTLSASKGGAYKGMYALFLFTEGRRAEAVREFERLAADDPSDRIARTRLVSAYRSVNRMGEAEAVLTRALAANAKDLDALLQRGEMLIAAGKYGEAEADLNQVLRLQPDSAETHYILAKLHQARGAALSYGQALAEAVKQNPFLVNARLDLVQHLLSRLEIRAASDAINATPESQKELPAVLAQRNWVLWVSGDMAGMRKGIDHGLSRERTPDLLVQDGIWKLRAGNVQGARAAIEEALNLNPADVRALRALNTAYAAQKQGALALQKVKEYASRQPRSAAIQEFLGLLLIANGDRNQARSALEASRAADPASARPDLLLAQIDVVDGKLDDAVRRLEKHLSSTDSGTLARQWLANVQIMKGNHKAALDHYRQVVATDTGNAEALNNLAFLLAEFGDQPAEALKYAQRAKELAPENPEYSDTLGWVLYRKGLYTLAVAELKRATAKQDNALWNYHLAMAYARAGDVHRGRTALQSALKKNPNLPEAKAAQEMLGMVR